MQPETPQRGNQEPFRTPNQAASQIPVISSSGRRRPRSNAMKLNVIFDAIDQVEWDVPKFLGQLFQKEKVDERHERVVKAMLNGTTKPYFGAVLNLIYEDAQIL